MTDCIFCHKPALQEHPLTDDGSLHAACDIEYKTRLAAGMCVRCGKNKKDPDLKLEESGLSMDITDVCTNCWENKLDYEGFPNHG